jgi:hypothetical protein
MSVATQHAGSAVAELTQGCFTLRLANDPREFDPH